MSDDVSHVVRQFLKALVLCYCIGLTVWFAVHADWPYDWFLIKSTATSLFLLCYDLLVPATLLACSAWWLKRLVRP